MRLMQPVLTVCILIIFYSGLYAQEKCGTVEYQKIKRATGKVFETDEQFENALAEKIRARKKNQLQNFTTGVPYRIPVVVHVIHNGEEEGIGRNISDAQIISQIDVLNKDFNRLNSDAGLTPTDFTSVAGNLDIEFVLAKQDSTGNCTDGIMRVNGNRDQWSLGLEKEFKGLSYWPAEDYLNIWVIKFQGFLGYAQFPVSSGLPGLEDENHNRLTDGVILDYRVFGTIDADPIYDLDDQYNKGRSATHEIGHFLGLRHIWGDDTGCAASDYADDTPNQRIETYNTPMHPRADACSSAIMFQNYMDYTDDVSMNLFTWNQIDRMITVLENSPRRNTLSSSHGLNEPIPGDIDLALDEIENPVAIVCNEKPSLKFTVTNLSGEDITDFVAVIQVNDQTAEVLVDFSDSPLTGSAQINVTGIELKEGDNNISVYINRINGKCDPVPENNALSMQTTLLYDCELFAIYTDANGDTQITFDLPEAAPVEINVLNMVGQVTARVQYESILNETVPLPLPTRIKGVYVVRLKIGTRYYSRKVYLQP